MIRLLLKLASIFVLAYAAVHLGYTKLEKELVSRSCFDIAGLPTPEKPTKPITQGDSNKKPQPRNSKPSSVGEPRPKNIIPLPELPIEGQSSLTENEVESASTLSTDVATNGQTIDDENPDFQVIIRRNIFQLIQQELPVTTEVTTTTVVEKPTEEVQTALNLTLLGTVMGDKRTSRAIIVEEKKTEQKLYQVGDAVQGALIESIERGKVTLDVFGAREILLLEKRKGGGPGLSIISRPPRPNRSPPVNIEDEELEDIEHIEDVEDIEDLEDFEEDKEDEALEEKRVRTRRRPPSIRPHRRINFRRNPIRNAPDMDEDEEDIPLDPNGSPEEE